MNVPNVLTLLRFGLIPIYWLVFFSHSPNRLAYAFIIMLIAGGTDILDGYLARRYNLITDLGVILDPLADKMMMLTVLLSLVMDGRVPWLAAGLLILRDLAMIGVSGYFHLQGLKTVPAVSWGKINTVLYYITLVALFFNWTYATTLLWMTVILSFLTSFIYLELFRKINPDILK